MPDQTKRPPDTTSEAVEFLVSRIYPARLINRARLDIGDEKSREDSRTYIEKADIYERALKSLSPGSLAALVDDERHGDAILQREREESQDRQRFFGKADAAANFELWSRRPCWTLEEATALILGKNPDVVRWEAIEPIIDVSPFAARFAAIRRHLTHARQNQQLLDPVSPGYFLSWANDRGVVLPQALEDCLGRGARKAKPAAEASADKDKARAAGRKANALLVREKKSTQGTASRLSKLELKLQKERRRERRRDEDIFSETVICFTRDQSRLRVMAERMRAAELAIAEQENDLTGEPTDGLLKMVLAMAVGRYGYEPGSERESTISDIVSDLERMGMTISAGTVLEWLQTASECLVETDGELEAEALKSGRSA